MFKLEIETDNDAFADTPGIEIARMLHVVADRIDEMTIADLHAFPYTIYDTNGNIVGKWELSE